MEKQGHDLGGGSTFIFILLNIAKSVNKKVNFKKYIQNAKITDKNTKWVDCMAH